MAFKRGYKPNLPPGFTLPDAVSGNSPVTAAAVNFGCEQPHASDPVSARDVAAYMADMLVELQDLARDSGFETLRRVLEIAEREAKWRMEEHP
jgi:metal-dependent amidase/aminoacylase/carboxypeptidase family protein